MGTPVVYLIGDVMRKNKAFVDRVTKADTDISLDEITQQQCDDAIREITEPGALIRAIQDACLACKTFAVRVAGMMGGAPRRRLLLEAEHQDRLRLDREHLAKMNAQ